MVALGLAQALGDLVVVLDWVHALGDFGAALDLVLELEDSVVAQDWTHVLVHLAYALEDVLVVGDLVHTPEGFVDVLEGLVGG